MSACAHVPDTGKTPIDNPAPGAGSNSAGTWMAAQAPLVEAASRVASVDVPRRFLAGIELLTARRVVVVWWKGEPSAALREEVRRQEQRHGIRFDIRPAAYSAWELNESRRLLVAQRASYPEIARISALVDGSGLEIATAHAALATPLPTLAVPVRVALRARVTPTSRGDDSAPWWGGATTIPSVVPVRRCSTGFAVARYFLWWETSRGILTANHCAPGGGVRFSDGVGQPIGVAETTPQNPLRDTDSLYVPAPSAPRIYDGGVGSGEFSKPVVGSTPLFPGQFVCTSGASTGVHCNILITSTENILFPPDGSIVEGVAMATEQAGAVATGSGDSGGPVFTLATDTSKALAAGLMVGGTDPVPCSIAAPGECFNTVLFVYIGYVFDSHGVRLLTQ